MQFAYFCVAILSSPVLAAWNPVTGVKNGDDTASELADPWDGERLLAFGGTLNFAGGVQLDGELWLQQMSGWGNPVVNIPGALTMSSPGGQFTVVGGANLNVANSAASSIEAGLFTVNSGVELTIGHVTVYDNLSISNPGTLLHVLGDFTQDGGAFDVRDSAVVNVDGTFTKTGHGAFITNSTVTFGDAPASSLEAGVVLINAGSQISVGLMTVHDDLSINNPGTLLHVLGDFTQDGGAFDVRDSAVVDVDGAFTKTGDGAFITNSTVTFGDAIGSSLEAGEVLISAGSMVSVGSMTVHDNAEIKDAGTLVHVLGDYNQDGGYLRINFDGTLNVDGAFTKTGNGEFTYAVGNSALNIGNPAASSLEAGLFTVGSGVDLTIGQITVHDNANIQDPGTIVHVLGDYSQDAGYLRLLFDGALDVDGTFNYTAGGILELRNNSRLTSEGPLGHTVSNDVMIDSGSQATIGHLAAHGNVTVNNPTSVLRVRGDYFQDAGNFSISDGATLNVEGSFRYAAPGPRYFLSFGSGFLRVGDTLTLEEGHFWNPGRTGGRIRVGDGLTAPAPGTFEITTNGTLAGEGAVVGDLANVSGTVSPGIGAGRLDITGNYVQQSLANLFIEVGGTLAELEFDQLFISGSANLAGTLTLELIDLGGGMYAPQLGHTFDILKAGGGISGGFTGLHLPALGTGLGWQLNYFANRVQLEVIAAAGLPGDFDGDGNVDGRDFLVWQRDSSVGDLADWQGNYGSGSLTAAVSVPEPSTRSLLFCLLLGVAVRRVMTGEIRIPS